MGLFSKLFPGRGVRCGECGKSVEPPEQLMTIMALDIDQWSLEGMSGYCPSCRQYLCSNHIEFLGERGQRTGQGLFVISCKSDGTPLTTGP
ncbi:MAG TPA: hypothetical protein VHL59_03235 [Thermoanaerobaculia bacterium]|nr:hypothetical protein [Thermoanaerobaculia bacterium]